LQGKVTLQIELAPHPQNIEDCRRTILKYPKNVEARHPLAILFYKLMELLDIRLVSPKALDSQGKKRISKIPIHSYRFD
jgi:hypothetical protein